MMKAVRMHGTGEPDVLWVDDVPNPVPGPGEVVIAVGAAGVTFGDVMARRGAFGSVNVPTGLGMQVAGVVSAVGTSDAAVAIGDRVAARVAAGYAEYAVARIDDLISVPETVDLASVSCLPVQGVTAYQLLVDAARLSAGESVLVHAAAGGVGGLAGRLAKLLGASTVIGAAGGRAKLDRVRAPGAQAVVDYHNPRWPDMVLEATEGAGVDVILDSVGGEVSQRGASVLAPFGRTVVYGAAGGVPAFDAIGLMSANQSVIGYSLFGWDRRPTRTAAALSALSEYVASAELRTDPGQTFPLEEAATAHQLMEARETVGTTVLLTDVR
ncbi:zinc-binding dehydrogenase [Spiractinospora alimapuensis]|uniref:quinone oxidoreductase family protein n=1 Tax=Spiractinospora alimapuensis TaxID=2820884 RepID=UPI001F292B04|nr:zinc-binding dehydrogenase [Spiractinospora alimapuensis]QVQ51567.1 zinc-binding dehydrogenase [Spiractinospora alimapuensis]